MKNFAQMMKQAQKMQENFAEMQNDLSEIEVSGQAAGGLVSVTMNAKGNACAVHIDPDLFAENDAEMLEDLIVVAINNASERIEEVKQEKLKELTGGLPLPPGLSLPF